MKTEEKEWIDAKTNPPHEAKDYQVTDGNDVWLAFKSLRSGGWWIPRLGGEGYSMETREITHYRPL